MKPESLRDAVIKIVDKLLKKNQSFSDIDGKNLSELLNFNDLGNIETIELIRNNKGVVTQIKSKSTIVNLNRNNKNILESVDEISLSETINYKLEFDSNYSLLKVVPSSDSDNLGTPNSIDAPSTDY